MNKLTTISKAVLASLLSVCVSICAHADDTQLWNSANQSNFYTLLNGTEGTNVKCAPVKKEGLSPITRNSVNFYECSALLEKSTGVVYKQIENEFSYYYVLFAGVKDIRMGANPLQFEMECADATGKIFYVLYDISNNTALRMADRTISNAKRVANETPELLYKQNGSMHKAYRSFFKCLATGDYEGAFSKRNEIYAQLNGETINVYPLWELGEAMLQSYPANYPKASSVLPRNLMTAYQYVVDVFKQDKYINEANALLASSEVRLTAGGIKSKIEEQLLEEARSKHTEAAYDQILQVLYESPLYTPARSEQEQLAMAKLGNSEYIVDILNYLNKYRYVNNDNTKMVESRLYRVAYNQMGGSFTDCAEYIEKYPLSPYVEEVKQMLHDRQFSQISRAADCKAFLDAHPTSPRCQEVWMKYADLALQETPDDEVALRKYLEDFSFAGKKKEVEDRILEIRYKKAVEEGTEEAFDEFLTNNKYNKYTTEIEQLRKELVGEDEEEELDEEAAPASSTGTRTYVKRAKKSYYRVPAAKPKAATPAPAKKQSTSVSDFKRLIGG